MEAGKIKACGVVAGPSGESFAAVENKRMPPTPRLWTWKIIPPEAIRSINRS
jgi:hypothetical protein